MIIMNYILVWIYFPDFSQSVSTGCGRTVYYWVCWNFPKARTSCFSLIFCCILFTQLEILGNCMTLLKIYLKYFKIKYVNKKIDISDMKKEAFSWKPALHITNEFLSLCHFTICIKIRWIKISIYLHISNT